VEFVRDDRFWGDPKMSLRKLFRLAADAIFSFSRFPIRLCLVLGIIGTVFFMSAGIYWLLTGSSGYSVSTWSSSMISIYFLGSIHLLFLGIMGEYIYRTYKESQNRPLYFVRKYYDGGSEKK
jgi:dolichol-phosphate mannosyltransferase